MKRQLAVVMCIVLACLIGGCDHRKEKELAVARWLDLQQGSQLRERLPWEDVEACLKDPELTHEGRPTDPEKVESMFTRCLSRLSSYPFILVASEDDPQLRPCPKCSKAPENLTWVFFISPDDTWLRLEGRAGWLTVCRDCHEQVDFVCMVMN